MFQDGRPLQSPLQLVFLQPQRLLQFFEQVKSFSLLGSLSLVFLLPGVLLYHTLQDLQILSHKG